MFDAESLGKQSAIYLTANRQFSVGSRSSPSAPRRFIQPLSLPNAEKAVEQEPSGIRDQGETTHSLAGWSSKSSQKGHAMHRYLVLLAVLLLDVASALADDGAEEFDALVKANVHPVTFDGQKAGGPGIDWLVREGAAAHYFLIGERHGLAEIPKISSAVFAGLAGVGYRHAALEVGPFAAIQVEAALKAGGFPALESYLTSTTGHGSVAFLDWQEEARMVAEMFAVSPNKDGFIWGLDQEFVGAFGAHLAFFAAESETATQRTAVAEMQAEMKAAAPEPGAGPSRFFIDMAADRLRSFLDLFREHPSADVRSLVEAIEISHHLYGPWAQPSRIARAESNIDRENYMKDNFLAYMRAAEAAGSADPKVFFKFGGYHSAPSIDTTNGRIMLGTFIEAYARIQGHTAFNLMIECYSGSRRSSGQDKDQAVDKKRSCRSSLGTIDAVAPRAERHLFSEFLDGSDQVLLVDLRPLRMRMNRFKFLSLDARRLLAGFDAYMTIPNTTESTSFVPRETDAGK